MTGNLVVDAMIPLSLQTLDQSRRIWCHSLFPPPTNTGMEQLFPPTSRGGLEWFFNVINARLENSCVLLRKSTSNFAFLLPKLERGNRVQLRSALSSAWHLPHLLAGGWTNSGFQPGRGLTWWWDRFSSGQGPTTWWMPTLSPCRYVNSTPWMHLCTGSTGCGGQASYLNNTFFLPGWSQVSLHLKSSHVPLRVNVLLHIYIGTQDIYSSCRGAASLQQSRNWFVGHNALVCTQELLELTRLFWMACFGLTTPQLSDE